MEDQLISFETAKLAKEVGFTEYTLNYFRMWYGEVQEREQSGISHSLRNKVIEYHLMEQEEYFQRPTQSLLQKWLREKDIHVEPLYDQTLHYYYVNINGTMKKCKEFTSYEGVLESGLYEGLSKLRKMLVKTLKSYNNERR